MANSLERYDNCKGCKHYAETRGQYGEVIMWCKKAGKYLNSTTEHFDNCRAKTPIVGAVQEEITFK